MSALRILPHPLNPLSSIRTYQGITPLSKLQLRRDSSTAMEYTRLGDSGLKISKVILGAMSYGTPEWQEWVLDEETSLPLLEHAYKVGLNTWDTVCLLFHQRCSDCADLILRRTYTPTAALKKSLPKPFRSTVFPAKSSLSSVNATLESTEAAASPASQPCPPTTVVWSIKLA